MRTSGILAGVAASCLLASACGERAEPKTDSVPLYPVTVPAAGQTIVSTSRPARIVALTRAAVSTLVELGVGERIVGVPASARRAVPRAAVVVESDGRLIGEELRRLSAELVVSSPFFDPAEVRRAIRAGAPVFVGPDDTISQVERTIGRLGLLVGEPLAARMLVADIERARRRVTGALRGRPLRTVFVDAGFFTTVSGLGLIGDVIRQARGRSVAGRTPEPGPFSLVALRRLDPQVYLVTSESDVTLAMLRRHPDAKRLQAVRRGRFGVVPSELLLPGAQIGAGLVAVARLLHPDAFR